MTVLGRGARLIEVQLHDSWIVDRFHLSARAFQIARYRQDVDFGWLEARLLPLDVRPVHATRRARPGQRPARM